MTRVTAVESESVESIGCKERKHDYRPATDVENEEESEVLREMDSRGLWKSRVRMQKLDLSDQTRTI